MHTLMVAAGVLNLSYSVSPNPNLSQRHKSKNAKIESVRANLLFTSPAKNKGSQTFLTKPRGLLGNFRNFIHALKSVRQVLEQLWKLFDASRQIDYSYNKLYLVVWHRWNEYIFMGPLQLKISIETNRRWKKGANISQIVLKVPPKIISFFKFQYDLWNWERVFSGKISSGFPRMVLDKTKRTNRFSNASLSHPSTWLFANVRWEDDFHWSSGGNN